MRCIKTLAFGSTKPKKLEMKKKLFYPGLAATLIFLGCSSARPSSPPVRLLQEKCVVDIENVVKPPELVLDTKCSKTMKFILTDKEIVTLYNERPVVLASEELNISLNSTRTGVNPLGTQKTKSISLVDSLPKLLLSKLISLATCI